jgi:hypothetical protein
MRCTPLTSSFHRAVLLAAFALALITTADRAAAVTVSILSVDSSAGRSGLAIGDTVTLDLGLAHTRDPIYGVGVSVYGYDHHVVEFVKLETATTFLNESLMPDGTPAAGFTNNVTQLDLSIYPEEMAEIIREATTHRVEIFQGISLVPISGDGSLDPGIGGELTGNGDIHARVTFRLIAAGLTTLSIGSDLMADAVVLEGGAITSATGTSYAIFPGLGATSPATVPTPEPGTALLLGLGLGILTRFRATRNP